MCVCKPPFEGPVGARLYSCPEVPGDSRRAHLAVDATRYGTSHPTGTGWDVSVVTTLPQPVALRRIPPEITVRQPAVHIGGFACVLEWICVAHVAAGSYAGTVRTALASVPTCGVPVSRRRAVSERRCSNASAFLISDLNVWRCAAAHDCRTDRMATWKTLIATTRD